MKWTELVIHTTTEAEDLVVALLSENGIDGAEIRDRMQILDDETMDLYAEVMPKQEEDDGLAEVVFYLEDSVDPGPVVKKITEGLEELRLFVNVGSGSITLGETEDLDWVNNWKQHFKAFYVGDILIKPTWVEKPADAHERLMIEIDPGTAFGTGAHETTKLCITGLLKWLKPGDKVLDVGTGSGILSIAALKLGASYAFGTDIDPLSITTARENAGTNGIPEEVFGLKLGDIISDEKTQEEAGNEYDLVTANILADVIIALQREIPHHMKKGALFIASGIIDLKAEETKKAILSNPALELLETVTLGEWVSYTARKK